MSRSYVLNLVHCVFSTKGRAQLIRDPHLLWAYLRGIARNLKFDLLAVGGTANHVHMLVSVPAARNLCDILRELKANSSRHMNEQQRGFAWQDGYGAISVSPSQREAVRNYIAHQAEHHRARSFDDEYTQWLQKTGILLEAEDVLG